MYTVKNVLPSGKRPEETIAQNETELKIIFELDKCIDWVKQKNVKRVCVQFSPDLLPLAPQLVCMLERALKQNVYILGDTSYSSCCADEVSAQHVNADCIIHFGHSCLSPSERLPILHIFKKENIDIEKFSSIFLSTFHSEDNILLLYEVSYHHAISNIKQKLKNCPRRLIVSELSIEEKLTSPTHSFFGRVFNVPDEQNLSNYSIVFIGKDGPCALNFKFSFPGQPFYLYDPSSSRFILFEMNTSKFLRRRMFLIESLKNVRNLGILIGTLSIQRYLDAVERIKYLTKSRGIKCYIISVGRINVAKLANFPEIDTYVLISCAENSLLDSKEFLCPIVTPYDVELAFNSGYKWSEKFVTDFTTLLPGCVNHVDENSVLFEEETNVSLVSGKVSNTLIENNVAENSTSLIAKGPDSVVLSNSHGTEYLNSRSWAGLEQKLGETVVEKASLGRSGLPFKYENETTN